MLFASDHTKHCQGYVFYDIYIKISASNILTNYVINGLRPLIVNYMFPENDDFPIGDTRGSEEIRVFPIRNEPMNFWLLVQMLCH